MFKIFNGRWMEKFRQAVLPEIHPIGESLGRPLIRGKGFGEYVCSTPATVEEVERALENQGYNRSVLSTKKYRVLKGGKVQWTVTSWAYRDHLFSDNQHHMYAFESVSGVYNLDIYHHKEPNAISKPIAHQDGSNQVHGDPDNVLRNALEAESIGFEESEVIRESLR